MIKGDLEKVKVYSTMTREKQDLKTINNKRVKLFVCGPTVYDDAHIGHGRTYISFDTIKRYLEYSGYSVFYIENITDIDDKIINRSKEIGIDSSTLAKKYEKRFIEDMHSLNVHKVNLFARATDHMDEIIDQITRLIKKGYAYETEDGVYYNIDKFEDFGKLSNRKIDELESHRDIADTEKHNPNDFVLWKKREAPEFEGEPKWDSPWGKGRPGWHIEDTAITEHYFGPQYDVHGGGLDLIFPHHEAEIAQIEAVSGKKPLVRYWMHTGFLNVSGEKMSKSLGNFITIRELLKDWDANVFRFFVLSTHYRSPIDFSKDSLHQAEKSLNKIQTFNESLNTLLTNEFENPDELTDKIVNANQKEELPSKIMDNFFDAMNDDFNTPKAISSIFEFIKEIKDLNTYSMGNLLTIKKWFNDISYIFGIDLNNTDSSETDSSSDDLLEIILNIREKLRENKQYDLSDEIRDELNNHGIEVNDS
jgi:cysteinyl-tRNA synthetase